MPPPANHHMTTPALPAEPGPGHTEISYEIPRAAELSPARQATRADTTIALTESPPPAA